MRHRLSIGIAAALLVLLVAAVAGAGAAWTPAAGAKTRHVTIQNMSFTPQTITVKRGTRVVWKNIDTVTHNVTSTNGPSTSASVTGLFASPTLNKGATFSFTFKKKGRFFYECTFHATMTSMHGKVIVKK